MQIERIANVTCAVGESPLWDPRDGCWYWVDIAARTIWHYDPAAGATRSWHTVEMVACIALHGDGGFIAGMESGMFRLRLSTASDSVEATCVATPPENMTGKRFNDGRCDRQGRFWSGTMAFDSRPVGNLYRYSTGQGMSTPVVRDLVTQNGLAWSPDGRTMYLSDSHASRQLIWAFDYDMDSGEPSGQRIFVDMHHHPGRPDGAAIDVDGCYWICANDAGMLHRFTPAGRLDRSLRVPVAKPSMCAFGGPDLATLIVASISTGAPPGDDLAGAVWLLDPGVAGMPETPFR